MKELNALAASTALASQDLAVRNALPIETREEPGDDPLAEATRAVEELRAANETFRTEQVTAREAHANEVRTLTERLTRMETRLNRPGQNDNNEPAEPTVEHRAFFGFIRQGRETLGAEEVRALRTDAQVAGGYLAPDQFEATILKELAVVSPIRAAARVTAVSSAAVILPKRVGTMTAKWVGETETRPATEPTYGQVEIPVHKIACYVDVSNRLLEDSAVDMEAELSADFAEEFGRLEGQAFVNGDGIKKPVGIMADASVPVVNSGSATAILPDSLITAMYALPVEYRNRGAWLMNGNTIAAVRKLRLGPDGMYMWMDPYGAGFTLGADQPPLLLGRPVIEAPDMPDIAAGATPIAFGDVGQAYRILDRVGLTVLRDPYSVAVNGLVRFHARRRVGGGVVRPAALRKLKIAA